MASGEESGAHEITNQFSVVNDSLELATENGSLKTHDLLNFRNLSSMLPQKVAIARFKYGPLERTHRTPSLITLNKPAFF